MIEAKKLLPQQPDTQVKNEKTTSIKTSTRESHLHNLVKLLILMMLTYAIIFMK